MKNVSSIEIKTRSGYTTKKVIGQLESGLSDDEKCADVLQRLAAARGAINSLMGELLCSRIISGTTCRAI
jgi:DNA-binding FrmR family transcriptional regulator